MTNQQLKDIKWWRDQIRIEEASTQACELLLEEILNKCDHRKPNGRSARYMTGTFSTGCHICGCKDLG
jgi:hypothetical protein